MDDLTDNEIAALENAGEQGGAFLEQLGKTDLASMEYEEWMQFITTVVGGYGDKLKELAGVNAREIPF